MAGNSRYETRQSSLFTLNPGDEGDCGHGMRSQLPVRYLKYALPMPAMKSSAVPSPTGDDDSDSSIKRGENVR